MQRPTAFRPSVRRATLLLAFLALSGCKNNLTQPDADGGADEATATKTDAAEEQADDQAAEQEAADEQKGKKLPAPKNVAAPPEGAETSESGLAWIVLKPGDGKAHPTPEDKVSVHYTGWTKDGDMFDSSEVRGRPVTFGLNRVIKGWGEGVQLMTKGAKYRFWIPGELAYGDKPRRPGVPAGQLTFDIELLDILSPPKTPENVASPPPTAKKTQSGLAYEVLEEGKPDGDKPTEKSQVSVHYSGWTKDGEMFDSSIPRGRPATFRVTGVIPGWTEGLQLMKEGAKYRFWIPADLAYGDKPKRPGAPSGQLTFDVELLEVN